MVEREKIKPSISNLYHNEKNKQLTDLRKNYITMHKKQSEQIRVALNITIKQPSAMKESSLLM